MEIETPAVVVGTLATLAGVAIAVASWRATQSQSRATAALTKIEQHRRWSELTPQFTVACEPTSGEQVRLLVGLMGPVGLERLDEVTVTIRNDRPDRTPVTAGPPTQDDLDRQIWGPYQFVRGVDGAAEDGRSVPAKPLLLGERLEFRLAPTPQPFWVDDPADWRRRYAGQPVRLSLRCRREGWDPWTIPVEVDTPGREQA